MENRNGVKSRRSYDADFNQEQIAMLMSGRSARELSQSYGIAENILYSWKSMVTLTTKTKNDVSEGAKPAKLLAEITKLRAESERLITDLEILKKALGVFRKLDP